MIRNVKLYGRLGKTFGRVFRLDVASVAEATRALMLQIPGLRAAIEAGTYKISIGPRSGQGLLVDKDLLQFRVPTGDIHIVPVAQGGKSGAGIGKLIVGTLLIAASFFVPVGGGILASIGISMALAGVSALLAPKKKKNVPRRSYMDQGTQTGGQGSAVPIVVGKFMVTPLVVSAGVYVADSNGYAGSQATPPPDGPTTSGALPAGAA